MVERVRDCKGRPQAGACTETVAKPCKARPEEGTPKKLKNIFM